MDDVMKSLTVLVAKFILWLMGYYCSCFICAVFGHRAIVLF